MCVLLIYPSGPFYRENMGQSKRYNVRERERKRESERENKREGEMEGEKERESGERERKLHVFYTSAADC